MTVITLADLFADLHGQHFTNRQELEEAVLEVFNRHVAQLPVGYSYRDAVDGARERGWLLTNGGGHGVRVDLRDAAPAAGTAQR